MKTKLTLILLAIVAISFGQENSNSKKSNNYFKLGAQIGGGFGFKNIDIIDYVKYDNDNNAKGNGTSSISGGGGLFIDITGEYTINDTFAFSMEVGYHASSLNPSVENAIVRFRRYVFQPTAKYIIPLNPSRNSSINLGMGYGFYTGNRLKFDATELGLKRTLDYKVASGLHFVTEYEFNRLNKFGGLFGLKFYNVNYQGEQTTGVTDFDKLKGSGIDFYIRFTRKLQ
jgi:hypothetical protein